MEVAQVTILKFISNSFRISMFQRAIFNSIIDKNQHMHFTFNDILVYNADFSMLKYIKILRHISILTDHHQGVGMYLVKVTELFKKH